MNDNYLMDYVSRHLHTIVRCYNSNRLLTDFFCARIDFEDTSVGDNIAEFFYESGAELPFPTILLVQNTLIYARIPIADHSMVVGPVKLLQTENLKYTYLDKKLDITWKNAVYCCDFQSLFEMILLVFNLNSDAVISQDELFLTNYKNMSPEELQGSFSDILFQNREEGRQHNPYDQEIREQSSITNGDLEQLKKSIEEDYSGELGTLAKNSLRNAKNLAIVVIALASRAAIQGGLLPEFCFSLSDLYIQKIEECKDIPSTFHIGRDAEFHYARLVKERKEEQSQKEKTDANPHIHKCKNYIFSHLHGKITVQEIADTLDLNANYLSGLFQKCEHCTISEFIQQEKIKLVKNLLIYSHYSYIEIAAYLGYTSQSHLGKQFKKATGMTLGKYREIYGVKEFTS